jgi:hypothetical protein
MMLQPSPFQLSTLKKTDEYTRKTVACGDATPFSSDAVPITKQMTIAGSR